MLFKEASGDFCHHRQPLIQNLPLFTLSTCVNINPVQGIGIVLKACDPLIPYSHRWSESIGLTLGVHTHIQQTVKMKYNDAPTKHFYPTLRESDFHMELFFHNGDKWISFCCSSMSKYNSQTMSFRKCSCLVSPTFGWTSLFICLINGAQNKGGLETVEKYRSLPSTWWVTLTTCCLKHE